jgi:transcription-repair coupling factor (superfamily II helicase)
MFNQIRSLSSYKKYVDQLQSGLVTKPLGLLRSARPALLTALWADMQAPVLVITDRMDRVGTYLDEIGFWQEDCRRLVFAEPVPLFYEQAAWGTQTRRDRLQVLSAFSEYHLPGSDAPDSHPLVVACAKAVMTRTLPRRDFLKAILRLSVGSAYPLDKLLAQLVRIGYQPDEIVSEPGQFARRGGIVDIWPMTDDQPIRLDFFGDDLDTIKRFDPASQRAVLPLVKINISPAREYLLPDEQLPDFEGQSFSEYHLPILHGYPASILDYLPRNTLVILDDSAKLQGSVDEIEEEAVKLRNESIWDGLLQSDYPIPYLTWSEIQDSLTRMTVADLGFGSAGEPSDLAEAFQPNQRFAGRLNSFIDSLYESAHRGFKQIVITRQKPRLEELWNDRTDYVEGISEKPVFQEGSLLSGFILRDEDGKPSFLYSDSEVFGWEKPQSRRKQIQSVEVPEAQYADFKPGDLVVHMDHGIGIFQGLVRKSLDGLQREFLALEYDAGDMLYVPIPQADRLTRYVGPDNQHPTLTRLGGQEWSNTKSKVRYAVQEIAQDLLDLYAQRQVAEGHAFSPDSTWQMELEGSFPYVETPDQMTAIQAVKRDMENLRPMDRLLCGDVGYGKTEVALRAAFKAVMDGRQVAVLVPTTVLAQQHYDTFRQRLQPFPANVEMLSRFRSPREQDEIIRKLGLGQIDIIIGTHRLISQDVQFKDLGLVIIDEEQRFGVTHKEHLKKLRTEVDVLTLTATPIPRTLYMALTGVRDISTINTPPEERLPVITHVGPYSPKLVRQAIQRELERGGQIFFLHNRVQTIPAMLMHLKKLVPEARIGIGHGQMDEHQLAAVMQQFNAGEIDILLCTSIIESGLDIPNANTLIVDRADTFGLAQLYQLRGRVGRGAQRAYAYFFRHTHRAPTAEGQERLEVIAENTQLGAGYSIAMRDLEMRGAGELLGMRQSGYIASVGFHLYTRLLASAVNQQRRLRGLPAAEGTAPLLEKEIVLPVQVDLPLAIEIPEEYVADMGMRLKLYRRIADADGPDMVDELGNEFTDRFGPLPQAVINLLFQMKVKLLAEQAHLASVSLESGQIVLRYPPLPEGVSQRILPMIGLDARAGKNAYWMPFDAESMDWQQKLVDSLTELVHLRSG